MGNANDVFISKYQIRKVQHNSPIRSIDNSYQMAPTAAVSISHNLATMRHGANHFGFIALLFA